MPPICSVAEVNDLVGHQGGDRLLQEVSKRLSQLADPASVFRLGGDEFLVIAKGLAAQKDANFAKLLIQAISQPIQVGTISCQVGASVGHARWPEQGLALEDVCHRSDIALYEVKGLAQILRSIVFMPAMAKDSNYRFV